MAASWSLLLMPTAQPALPTKNTSVSPPLLKGNDTTVHPSSVDASSSISSGIDLARAAGGRLASTSPTTNSR
jgi:hypothetical protein